VKEYYFHDKSLQTSGGMGGEYCFSGESNYWVFIELLAAYRFFVFASVFYSVYFGDIFDNI
jgi:hypothetical protein